MVFHVSLGFEVGVDHLANWGGAVYTDDIFSFIVVRIWQLEWTD